MRIIPVEALYDRAFEADVINGLAQYWRDTKTYSNIGHPRPTHLFLYLDGCRTEYRTASGKLICGGSGDVIFAPKGSEYKVRFFDFESKDSHSVCVNFLLTDGDGTSFALSDTVTVYHPGDPCYRVLFEKLDRYSAAAVRCPARLKAAFYEILADLASRYRENNLQEKKYGIISKGIVYLESEGREKLPVGEIAAMCGVSETYFYKLFRAYSGMSPTAFRLEKKLERACLLLKNGEMNVAEIADYLGFENTSYFTRLFRAHIGVTPSAYRRKPS